MHLYLKSFNRLPHHKSQLGCKNALSFHLRQSLLLFSGTLSGRLFLYDGLSFSTRVIKLRPRQPGCVICGESPAIKQLIDYNEFCGAPSHDGVVSTAVSVFVLVKFIGILLPLVNPNHSLGL